MSGVCRVKPLSTRAQRYFRIVMEGGGKFYLLGSLTAPRHSTLPSTRRRLVIIPSPVRTALYGYINSPCPPRVRTQDHIFPPIPCRDNAVRARDNPYGGPTKAAITRDLYPDTLTLWGLSVAEDTKATAGPGHSTSQMSGMEVITHRAHNSQFRRLLTSTRLAQHNR